MDYDSLQSFQSVDKKLWFRPADDGDIDFIVNLRNSGYVRNRFVYRDDFTRESQKKWMDTKVYTGEVVQYIFGTGEKRVGCVYILPLEDGSGRGELGIFMDEAYSGQGFGTVACVSLMEYALRLGFTGYVSRAVSDNKASIRMMNKSGLFEKRRIIQKSVPEGEDLEMVLMERKRESFNETYEHITGVTS